MPVEIPDRLHAPIRPMDFAEIAIRLLRNPARGLVRGGLLFSVTVRQQDPQSWILLGDQHDGDGQGPALRVLGRNIRQDHLAEFKRFILAKAVAAHCIVSDRRAERHHAFAAILPEDVESECER